MSISNIQKLIDLISTAKAVYSDLTLPVSLTPTASPEAKNDLKRFLTDSADFTEVEADIFVERYKIAAPFEATSNGLESIVFYDTLEHKHVLAIRGSEEVWNDFIIADGIDGIGPNGVANKQAVDLYRYWKKITTTKGDAVTYSDDEIIRLIALNAGTTAMVESGSAVFNVWANEFRSDIGVAEGNNRLYSSTVVDVTGHSLGGNLVYGFASMFPENVGEAVTINGPGIDRNFFGNGQDLLSAIGFSVLNESKITSINAEGDWVHYLSGDQPGFILNIAQETGHNYFPGFDGVNNNHSVINGLDSFSLMNLFSKFDTTLANKPAGFISNVIRYSSHIREDTFEIMLDGLRRILFGDQIDPTLISAKADLENRNDLYNNIDEIMQALKDGGELSHLSGRLRFVSVAGGGAAAKQDYGQFLSLYYLTPFAIWGYEDELKTLNPDLYALWKADQSLTQEQIAKGELTFSDEWYQDRFAMSRANISRNFEDEVADTKTNKGDSTKNYFDYRLNTAVESVSSVEVETQVISFGDRNNNNLLGGFYDDRIYGGFGEDTLTGNEGDDSLFGGIGNDTLNGNKGNDLLDGGADNDTLNGGEGHDILKGGTGTDTYIFDTNFGKDHIIDADGKGSIIIGGVTLSTLKLVDGTDIIYRDSVDNPKFEIIKINNGTTTDLLITALGSSGGQILVKDWKETAGSNLGITLDNSVETTAFTPEIINGNNNNNALSVYNLRDTDPTKNITAVEATEINGGVGNDIIMGMADSRDKIVGGDGNDIISGGFTSDSSFNQLRNGLGQIEKDNISGGAGADFIFSSVNGSVSHGDADNDVLIGNAYATFIINPQGEYGGQSAHAALTRDQIYADLLTHMDFSFAIDDKGTIDDASDDSVSLNLTYTKNFTDQFQEFTGAGSGANFIAKETQNRVVTDNGKLKHAISGRYQLTYDYTNNNGLAPASSANPMPVDFFVTQYQLSNTADADAIASLKGVNFYGDQGRDFLWGSLFADYLSGGDDSDFIYANYGHDILDGGSGDDYLNGEGGNDILLGGEGKDRLWGGEGDDQLFGGDGDDHLHGENGNDYLVGGAGKDSFWGGEGNDIIVMSKEDGTVYGEGGNDLFIIDDIAYTESQVNQNNTNPNVSPYLVGTQNGQSLYRITINDIEGSNTIALVGSNTSSINAQAQDNDVMLTSGDTSIYLVNGLQGSSNNIATGTSTEAIQQNQFTQQLSINDFLVDAISNSVNITAQTAKTEIVGGRVNDTLTAHTGGSQLRGGKGDDQLNGDIGNDTYIYSLNDGNDTITEKGGSNSIKFAANVTADMLDLKRVSDQLQVHISNGQVIRVSNMFDTTGAIIQANAIQQIQFADGTTWDQTKLLQEIIRPRNFTGTDFSETLIGAEGNDTLTGKKGNDQLQGGLGDDTYQFSATDGKDTITDSQGNDRILFDNTVDENSIIVRRDTQNNLLINIDGNNTITLNNAVNADGTLNSNSIESIQFANGNVWDIAKLQTEIAKGLSITQNGTTNNDTLKGDNANNIFIGNQGNDTLKGGAANDTYRYALGDGNDVIQDINGNDKLLFTNISDPSSVLVERDGNNLKLTPIDGSTITINNYFAPKAAVVVDPNITAIIDQLQNRWLAQAEKLIETHYGLTMTGQIHLSFVSNVDSPEAAHIELEYISGEQKASKITLEIDLTDFANAVNNANGSGPLYFDRIIAHEMVHALMGANMDMTQLPPWFKEGTAEFIHGADERVQADLPFISAGQNFVALFHNATIANPDISAGYSVSYIAVKILDNEIRSNGGAGIKDIFDHLKTGKTLDQALTAISAAYPELQSLWTNLSDFENHVKAVGFSQISSLLNLLDSDTGSIAGSDYGNAVLNAETIVPDASVGSPTHLQLTIPENYIESPELNGTIETIEFANGVVWDQSQVLIEIQNTIDRGLNRSFIGTSANDTITATDGNDQITGLAGNDQLNGLAGDDTYIYNLGDGNDTIVDTAGVDEIRFGAGILAEDVRVQKYQANHLQFLLLDGSVITIQNAFDAAGNFTTNAIENIRFADSSVWNQSQIFIEIQNLQDQLFNRSFTGTASNDVVIATDGNNQITGLAGDDQLNGLAGNDTYIYNLGDGNDTIVDTAGVDEIRFGAGILAEDVRVQKYQTYDMQILLADAAVITVKNAFDAAGNFTINAIENIQFADNSVWNQSRVLVEIQNHLNRPFVGSVNEDVIVATEGDNTITGLAGNDQLNGGAGNDVYVYSLGDGSDTIIDAAGVDEIRFGEGINADDVSIQKGQDFDLLIFLIDGSTITVKNVFDDLGNFSNNAIESIVFHSGDYWDTNKIKEESEKIYSRTLYGTSLSDTLIGGMGRDILEGGKGDDYLQGGESDDTYRYSHGDGNDIISDINGMDTIEFGEGIYSDRTILKNDGQGNLNILLKHGDVITIENAFDAHGNITNQAIESIKFIDGTVWDVTKIKQLLLQVSNRNDFLIGDSKDNFINGGLGDDTINGMAGRDNLVGGAGNDILISGEEDSEKNYYDVLRGGEGYDTLITSRNSKALLEGGTNGAKYIVETGSIKTYIRTVRSGSATVGGLREEERILVLPEGIDESDLTVRFVADINPVLEVSYVSIILSTGEIIEVAAPTIVMRSGQIGSGSRFSIHLDKIQFSNGVSWDKSRIQLESIRESNNNDKIIGSELDDVFSGSKGNDILMGLEGNDTYHFNIGDGRDVITDVGGLDSIVFGDGILKEDVVLSANGNNLIVNFAGHDDQITIINGAMNPSLSGFHTGSPGFNNIEYFKFSNGDVWDFNPLLQSHIANGDASDNRLYGGDKADILNGSTGNDYLAGGKGDDTYIYALGDGNDTIFETGGEDRIQFAAGINPEDISVNWTSGSLNLYYDAENSISIQNVLNAYDLPATFNNSQLIEQVIFSNGVEWNFSTMLQKAIRSTDDGDVIVGVSGATLNGGAGDDLLLAEYGASVTYIGGTGNDEIRGSLGDDTYKYSIGDGYDQIVDAGGYDVIEFGPNILFSDLVFNRRRTDLLISLDSSNAIVISEFYDAMENGSIPIEELRFADGTTKSIKAILDGLNAGGGSSRELIGTDTDDLIIGTAYNDSIQGRAGNDRLIGGGGDDELEGGHGNDILIGGDGNDYLFDSSGENIYQGGKGNDYIFFQNSDYKSTEKATIKFDLGDGIDTVTASDHDSNFRIDLGFDISPNDIILVPKIYGKYFDLDTFKKEGFFDLRISGTDEGILSLPVSNNAEIAFSNGVVWTKSEIVLKSQKNISYMSQDKKTLFGNSDPGNNIILTYLDYDNRTKVVGSSVVDEEGFFEVSSSISLNDLNRVSIKIYDQNQNYISSHSKIFLVPATDVVPSLSIDELGFLITGTYTPGDSIVVDIYDSIFNVPERRFLDTDPVTGKFEIFLPTPLIKGETIRVHSTRENNSPLLEHIAPDYSFEEIQNMGIPSSDLLSANLDSTGYIVTGTSAVNTYVQVLYQAEHAIGLSVLGYAKTDSEGNYSVNLRYPVLDKGFYVRVISQAGSSMSALIPTEDRLAPAVVSGEFDSFGWTVSGYAEHGSEVIIKNISGEELQRVEAFGSYQVRLSSPLYNGEKIFIYAQDAAGNISDPLELTAPDKIPPAKPSAAFTDSQGKIISGVAEVGSTVIVKNSSGTQIGTTTANTTTGSYTVTLATALINKETVEVTATDNAGNISTARLTVAPDLTAPAIPTASFNATGKIITGVAEVGSTVIVKNSSGTQIGSTNANTTGSYTVTLAAALINKETVEVTARDSAGNISSAAIIAAPLVTASNPVSFFMEAENYTSMNGVQKESTRDVGGGQNVGYIESGDWMAYNTTFNVPTAGRYKVTYRVASLNGGGRLTLKELSNDAALGSITVPRTNDWQNWVDVTQEITLSAGNHNFKLAAEVGGFNVNWFKLEPLEPATTNITSTPIIIQAENYTSMSGVQKESTSDLGGGQNVGYIESGDWMAYNAALNVPASGRYKVTYRVASPNGGGRLTLKELSNDAALGSITVPRTNGWQNWVDVTQEVSLSAGDHNFKLAAEVGGFNVNWFKLERLEPVALVPNTEIRAEQLIQAMASFAPASGIEANVLSGLDERINALIAVGQ